MKNIFLLLLLPISFPVQAVSVAKIAKKAGQDVATVKSNGGKIATAVTIGAIAGMIAYDNKETITKAITEVAKNPPSLSAYVKAISAVPGAFSAYAGAVAIKEFFAGTDGGFRFAGAAGSSVLSGYISAMIFGLGLALENEEIS